MVTIASWPSIGPGPDTVIGAQRVLLQRLPRVRPNSVPCAKVSGPAESPPRPAGRAIASSPICPATVPSP